MSHPSIVSLDVARANHKDHVYLNMIRNGSVTPTRMMYKDIISRMRPDVLMMNVDVFQTNDEELFLAFKAKVISFCDENLLLSDVLMAHVFSKNLAGDFKTLPAKVRMDVLACIMYSPIIWRMITRWGNFFVTNAGDPGVMNALRYIMFTIAQYEAIMVENSKVFSWLQQMYPRLNSFRRYYLNYKNYKKPSEINTYDILLRIKNGNSVIDNATIQRESLAYALEVLTTVTLFDSTSSGFYVKDDIFMYGLLMIFHRNKLLEQPWTISPADANALIKHLINNNNEATIIVMICDSVRRIHYTKLFENDSYWYKVLEGIDPSIDTILRTKRAVSRIIQRST